MDVLLKLIVVYLIFSIQRHYLYITIVPKRAVTTYGALFGLIVTAAIIVTTNKRFDSPLFRYIHLFFWSVVYGIGLSAVLLFVNYQFRQQSLERVSVQINSAWPKGDDAYWISTVYKGKRKNLPLEAKFPDVTSIPKTAYLIMNKGYFGYEVISDIEVERKLPTTLAF